MYGWPSARRFLAQILDREVKDQPTECVESEEGQREECGLIGEGIINGMDSSSCVQVGCCWVESATPDVVSVPPPSGAVVLVINNLRSRHKSHSPLVL